MSDTAASNISPHLVELSFGEDIERLTADFVGREWVFAAVERWLADPDGSRFFILTGEPGAGKSAIAARLAQTQPRVLAHHFCIAGRSATITPGAALRSLAAQFGENLPGYGEALANTIRPTHLSVRVDIHVDQLNGGQIVGVVIEHLHAADPQQELDILLRAPLAALRSPPPMAMILIDALDEAVTFRGDPNLAVLLAGADDLPPWVRFFCTTRPERRALRYFDAVQPYLLATETEMNLADIRQFIAGRLADPEFAPRLAGSRIPAPALTEHLVELSSGNFLYTRVLLDDIAAGRQSLDDLDALPRSLDQIFLGFLSRFTVQEWDDCYRPILGVLAVAAQPLTEGQLSNFTGLGPTRTRQSLGVVGQFLDVGVTGQGQKAFGLFHRSLQDYLLDEKRSGDFWCAAEDGHRCIADYYLANFRDSWAGCDDYGLRYLVEHLHALRRRPADRKSLFETIGPAFMRAKRARYGSHQPYAGDVSLVIVAAQEAHDLVQEIRCGLIYSTLAELATDTPPGLLAALAWTGQTEQARSLVGLKQPADQAPAYGAIGSGLLRRDARQEAQDTLLQSLAVAEVLADEGERASSLAKLAEPFADAGMTGQLLEAMRTLETPAHRALALAAIARASASSGQTAGLAELAEETLRLSVTAGDAAQDSETKRYIAEVFALVGQTPWAAALAKEVLVDLAALSSPASQADALASAVEILVMAGEARDAEEARGCTQKAIEGVGAAWDRAYVRAKIAQGLIRQGRDSVADALIQEALDDLREVESADMSQTEKEAFKALALAELLRALVQRGYFERATELVQATRGKIWRAVAARTLVEALAKRGEIERAQQFQMWFSSARGESQAHQHEVEAVVPAHKW